MWNKNIWLELNRYFLVLSCLFVNNNEQMCRLIIVGAWNLFIHLVDWVKIVNCAPRLCTKTIFLHIFQFNLFACWKRFVGVFMELWKQFELFVIVVRLLCVCCIDVKLIANRLVINGDIFVFCHFVRKSETINCTIVLVCLFVVFLYFAVLNFIHIQMYDNFSGGFFVLAFLQKKC